jgi:hypothetical protein
MTDFPYDVAISFAGEDRSIADLFARRLELAGYSVFYDNFEAVYLWGSDLSVKLGEVYGELARYCLMLVSHHYVEKQWAIHERRFAIGRLIEKGEGYILPVKLDGTAVPGLPPTIGYLSLEQYSLDQIFVVLLEKLGKPTKRGSSRNISRRDKRTAEKVVAACNRRAIFTRMESEIRIDAMFTSIENTIHALERLGTEFEDSALQHLTLQIVRELDNLERFRTSTASYRHSQAERQMNLHKERAIRTIHEVRRYAGVTTQLPTEMTHDAFFDLKEADEPPDLRIPYWRY